MKIEEESNVEKGTKKKTGSAEFASAAYYFKDFRFDFTLKGGVKFVTSAKQKRGWDVGA